MDKILNPGKELNKLLKPGEEVVTSNLSIIKVIGYSLAPVGGQIVARIVDLDGSLDMPWFFFPIFLFPPFQTIPLVLMYLGYIKKGKGGKVADLFVFIPIIVKLFTLGCLYMIKMYYSSSFYNFAYFGFEILMILTIAGTKYLHVSESCKYTNKKLLLTSSKVREFFIDAIFENGIASIGNIIINFIPGVGWVIGLIRQYSDTVDKFIIFFIYAVVYATVYVIQNMYEQTNMESMCNLLSIPISSWIKLGVGLFITITLILYNFLSGFSIKGFGKSAMSNSTNILNKIKSVKLPTKLPNIIKKKSIKLPPILR